MTHQKSHGVPVQVQYKISTTIPIWSGEVRQRAQKTAEMAQMDPTGQMARRWSPNFSYKMSSLKSSSFSLIDI